jgi:hypothetical protein
MHMVIGGEGKTSEVWGPDVTVWVGLGGRDVVVGLRE